VPGEQHRPELREHWLHRAAGQGAGSSAEATMTPGACEVFSGAGGTSTMSSWFLFFGGFFFWYCFLYFIKKIKSFWSDSKVYIITSHKVGGHISFSLEI